MKLVVMIDMGNDSMQTPHDVGLATVRAGVRIMDTGTFESGIIMDTNGNYVGNWRFTDNDD